MGRNFLQRQDLRPLYGELNGVVLDDLSGRLGLDDIPLMFLKPLDLDVNSVNYSRDLTTNCSRIIAEVMLASDALE